LIDAVARSVDNRQRAIRTVGHNANSVYRKPSIGTCCIEPSRGINATAPISTQRTGRAVLIPAASSTGCKGRKERNRHGPAPTAGHASKTHVPVHRVLHVMPARTISMFGKNVYEPELEFLLQN
jgi:hypothetical protein